jgi:hypothetical protein
MSEDSKRNTSPAELADAARTITENIVAGLRDAALKPDASDPRLFFPEGIELINVVVKIGPADVEVEIAGAKGLTHFTGGRLEVRDPGPALNRDVTAADQLSCHSREEIIWFNNTGSDATITFAAVNSPVADFFGNPVNGFTVPRNGGTYPTWVAPGDTPNVPYPYSTTAAKRGNPSIIIQ